MKQQFVQLKAQASNFGRRARRAAIGAAVSLGSIPAFAAVDTAELDSAKADAIAVCVIVFGILVAIAAYKYVKRAL